MPQVQKARREDSSVEHAALAPSQAAGAADATSAAGSAAVSRILAHENVGSLPLYEKLFKGALHGGHAFEKEALHSLVTALEIAVPVWIVSHAFGLGEIIDMIGMTLAAKDTVTAVEELITFFKVARSASSDADLEKAGEHFGRAVALVGVGVLVGMFAKFGARGTAEAGEVHSGGAAGEAHAAPAHAAEAPVAHETAAPSAPAAHVEAHHESPHLKPNVRAVITELKNRGVIMEHLERAHKTGGATDLNEAEGGEGGEQDKLRQQHAKGPAHAAGAPALAG